MSTAVSCFCSSNDILRRFLQHRVLVAVLFSSVTLLVTEIVHSALEPEVNGANYTLAAHLLTAALVGFLFERVLYAALQRYEATLENMKTISLMNHHIRNALEAISLSTYFIQNKSLVPTILRSVDRIDQALRLGQRGIRPIVSPEQHDLSNDPQTSMEDIESTLQASNAAYLDFNHHGGLSS